VKACEKWFWSMGLLAMLGLSACASSKGSATGGGDSSNSDARISPERQSNEKVTEYDLNHDKRPDVWSFSVPAKTEDGREYDRVLRKELDINWDGRVDITRIYGEKEQIDRESLDLDFDGKVDQVNYYEKGVIVRKERDLNYDLKPDLWLFFEKGKIVRKERDSNGDGKVDYWEYWEGDKVDRIGEDLDADGNVDKWTKSPNAEG
jgi:hypothetical protein